MRYAIIALLALCTPATAAPLSVYVLAGQSNMYGWGASSELYGALASPQPVRFHAKGSGYGYLRPFDDDFGPEITFGRTMDLLSREEIAIVKHAKGSTSLAVDWNPSTGPLYAELMARTTNSLNYWKSLGYDVRVAGIVWMQGEEDARHAEMAYAYGQNFANLIQRMRSDLQSPNAPFIYGQIRGKDFAWKEAVRTAQATAQISNATMVLTDDLPTYEGLHFTTSGQLSLGSRFAKAMKIAQSRLPSQSWGSVVTHYVPEPGGLWMSSILVLIVSCYPRNAI